MAVAAIFDMDGTLVTFKFDVQGTRKALIELLSSHGFDTSGLGLTTPTQLILDSARAQTTASGPGAYEELRSKVYAVLDEFELESVSSTTPFPGTRQALVHLKSRGVRLAVLTNSGRRAATEALRRANLGGCFEFVLTRDDIDAMKPKPDGLKKAIALLGLPLSETYYIGDSTYDIHAAKGAGIRVVSVATGNYSAERLKAEGADFVISSVPELGRILGV
jgi:HAD superfamily hydrolase (TIGR01549 family)